MQRDGIGQNLTYRGSDFDTPLPQPLEPGSNVIVALRPERVRLVRDGGDLRSRVETVVYMGNDTMYHLTHNLRVRVPNAGGSGAEFAPGAEVGLCVPVSAVQILEDAS